MKLVRFGKQGREKPGILDEEGQIRDLSSKLKSNSKTLLTLKARIDNLREYLKRPNEILINHGILREKSARTTGLLYSTENALALAKITLNKSPPVVPSTSVPQFVPPEL